MISDTLSEASDEIERYQRDFAHAYEGAIGTRITALVAEMLAVQVILDTPWEAQENLMRKPFIRRGATGIDTELTGEAVVNLVDANAGIRLALTLWDKGVLTDHEFLDVVRPGYDIESTATKDGLI